MALKTFLVGKILKWLDDDTIASLVYNSVVAMVINKTTQDITIGTADKVPGAGKLYLGEICLVSHGAEATKPTAGDGILYIKSGKIEIRYNDAGTNRFYYFDLAGAASGQFTYSATEV